MLKIYRLCGRYIFLLPGSGSWEDKQNVSNDERDMTVNDNEDLIYLFGGFLYFIGGTPSHHPFIDGIFHEINHPASSRPGYPG